MADWVAATALWALALVLAYSGAVKLADPRPAAIALVDFGVARRVRPALGRAVGAYEALLAAALVAAILGAVPAAAPASVAALTFLLFAWFLARGVRAGAEFGCNCFGASDGAVSAADVARTALLAALAAAAVAGPATIDDAHLPAAPVAVAATLLGAALVRGALRLRGVNADPLGERPDRWEQRLHGH
ncbi:MAG TPA: MauE/DoxX family redox-associated membrane protein [Solirubrobacteraceae bacterium]|jgi:hypothetical protein